MIWKGRQDKGHQPSVAAFRHAIAGGENMPTETLLASWPRLSRQPNRAAPNDRRDMVLSLALASPGADETNGPCLAGTGSAVSSTALSRRRRISASTVLIYA